MKKLELCNSFEGCPRCWKSFIDMLEADDADRDVGGFTTEEINKRLKPYNAIFYEDDLSDYYLEFETEEDLVVFKLTFV